MAQHTLEDITSSIATKISVKADKSQIMAKASVAEAEAGTDDSKAMTPATTKAAVLKLAPTPDLNSIKQTIVDMLYPIGAVYISINSSFNPNVTLGGAWVKIENKFLLASGSRAIGVIGGEENVTLSVNQIPSHNHDRGNMNITGKFGTRSTAFEGAFYEYSKSVFNSYGSAGVGTAFSADRAWSGRTGGTGGGQSHNNMPPYIVVDIWKREG